MNLAWGPRVAAAPRALEVWPRGAATNGWPRAGPRQAGSRPLIGGLGLGKLAAGGRAASLLTSPTGREAAPGAGPAGGAGRRLPEKAISSSRGSREDEAGHRARGSLGAGLWGGGGWPAVLLPLRLLCLCPPSPLPQPPPPPRAAGSTWPGRGVEPVQMQPRLQRRGEGGLGGGAPPLLGQRCLSQGGGAEAPRPRGSVRRTRAAEAHRSWP